MAVTYGKPQEEKPKISAEKPEKIPAKPEEGKPEGKEGISEAVKEKIAKLKPEFKELTLYGVKILRERDTETNKIKFYESSKDKSISSLQEWIKNKLKEAEKKKIEESLKAYETLFKELNIPESEKQTRLEALKKQCFKLHEDGKTPQKFEEIPANINLVLKRISVSQFSVNASAEKITIPYALVLPPHVSTIIITRENSDTKEKKQIVCIKFGLVGNEHFFDAETGKPVFLKPNDIVDIAAITAPETAAGKVESVAADVKTSQSGGGGGGGFYGGGGGGGGGGGSPSGSAETDKKTDKKSEERPKMTNQDLAAAKKDTKENSENYGTGDFNVRKFENREFNGGRPVYLCTFPKKLDPNKKTRFVLYFHGFGDARTKGPDMLKNRETIGGLDKHSKEKNENIVFVIPQGENPDGANYWGDTVSSQNKLENLINYSLHEAFEGKNTPETKVDKYLMGHSGANYAMERVLKNMPSNYFKGIGLFDTLYSKGTGEKYSDLLRNKHSRTDVYSVFRTIGGPGNNNPILKAAMAENKEGPKGHFETSTKDHGDIKYPGVPNALAYFVSSEKPETPVQPTEPSAPKNPDQRTA